MKRARSVLIGLAVVAGCAALYFGVVRKPAKEVKQNVQTATVERGTVRKTVSADGVLAPLTMVEVKSYAGGNVDVLAVEVGDRVQAGDLIARIDPTDSQTSYDQAIADLNSAEAKYTQAVLQAGAQPEQTRMAIRQAQAGYDAVVKDLEKLRTADHPQEKASVQATADRARAALDSAREDLDMLTGATQPQDLASAKASLESARTSLHNAEKDLQRLRAAGHPQASTQAQSALSKAQSTVGLRKIELDRTRALLEDGYVAESEFDIAQNQYDTAVADLASARETANTIQADQAAELQSAEARVEQARAELASAQRRWDTLQTQHSGELKNAQSRVAQAEADLASAQKRLDTLGQEQEAELRAAEAKVEQQRAALARARADAVTDSVRVAEVRSAEASVARAEAQVTNAQITLGYTTIVAPRDGVILETYVEEGTMVTSGRSSVTAGTVLVDLGDISAMYVEVEVDEADVTDLTLGMAVEITTEAVEDDMFHGTVTRIDPQATEQSNVTTLTVEVEVQEQDERLVPGMTASCDFLIGLETDTLYLPRRAVQQQQGKHFVQVQTDGDAEVRPVRIGLEGDDNTQIVEGLREGDQVIIPQLGSKRPSFADEMKRRAMEHSGGGNFLRK